MKILKEIVEQIFQHAEKEAPIEACGYLAGADNVINSLFNMTNIDQSEEHFSFDPNEQFQTIKQIRASKLRSMAIYHSHPNTPARPSQEDINLAYDPDISYVIASIADGQKAIKSFKITKGIVIPEIIEII